MSGVRRPCTERYTYVPIFRENNLSRVLSWQYMILFHIFFMRHDVTWLTQLISSVIAHRKQCSLILLSLWGAASVLMETWWRRPLCCYCGGWWVVGIYHCRLITSSHNTCDEAITAKTVSSWQYTRIVATRDRSWYTAVFYRMFPIRNPSSNVFQPVSLSQ
jgi:hypothetical protein